MIISGGILGWRFWKAREEEKRLEQTRYNNFVWNTYTDKENEYEVKYPDNWMMGVYKNPYESATVRSSVRWYPPWVPSHKIETMIEQNVGNEYGEYSISMILFGENIKCEDTKINKLTFCKLVRKPNKPNIMNSISYSISKNSKIYTIAIWYKLPENEIQTEFKIFDQMLSTFKFLE